MILVKFSFLSVNGLTLLLGVIVGNASVLLKNKDKFGVDCVNAMTSVAFVVQVNTIVLQIIVVLINVNVSSPFSITWIYYCIKGDIGADEMCSGRGDCSCKECKCYPDWSGEDCSCSLKVDSCLSPYTNSYCSRESKFTTSRGKEALTTGGQCECNKCVCSKVSSIW